MGESNKMIVQLTVPELEALIENASERGARRIANELRDRTRPVSQLCEEHDVSRSTVHAAITRGELSVVRKGGKGAGRSTLVLESEFMRWLRAKGAA